MFNRISNSEMNRFDHYQKKNIDTPGVKRAHRKRIRHDKNGQEKARNKHAERILNVGAQQQPAQHKIDVCVKDLTYGKNHTEFANQLLHNQIQLIDTIKNLTSSDHKNVKAQLEETLNQIKTLKFQIEELDYYFAENGDKDSALSETQNRLELLLQIANENRCVIEGRLLDEHIKDLIGESLNINAQICQLHSQKHGIVESSRKTLQDHLMAMDMEMRQLENFLSSTERHPQLRENSTLLNLLITENHLELDKLNRIPAAKGKAPLEDKKIETPPKKTLQELFTESSAQQPKIRLSNRSQLAISPHLPVRRSETLAKTMIRSSVDSLTRKENELISTIYQAWKDEEKEIATERSRIAERLKSGRFSQRDSEQDYEFTRSMVNLRQHEALIDIARADETFGNRLLERLSSHRNSHSSGAYRFGSGLFGSGSSTFGELNRSLLSNSGSYDYEEEYSLPYEEMPAFEEPIQPRKQTYSEKLKSAEALLSHFKGAMMDCADAAMDIISNSKPAQELAPIEHVLDELVVLWDQAHTDYKRRMPSALSLMITKVRNIIDIYKEQ
jgi:hypothetical protein